MTAGEPVRGRVDRDGRLTEADARLAALQASAGGQPNGPIAVPQLATLARLVGRLGIVVSRPVIAADRENDLDLWVRAAPDGEGVALAIVGWTARPPALPFPAPALVREHDFLRADADWLWETDASLRLTAVSASAATTSGRAVAKLLGQPLARLFTFVPQEDGALPILEAAAQRAPFDDQLAELRGLGRRIRLSGTPILDAQGRFAGFRGAVRTIAGDEAPQQRPAPSPQEETAYDADAFGQQLDRALRQPLDRIVAIADSIRRQADGPLRPDYVDYGTDIATAARHLLALVDDLVDLSAIERADFRPEPASVDLADLARRAAGLLAVRAAERGVAIERPATEATVAAAGDFRRALQILVNLVGNAIRYAPPWTAVAVRAYRSGAYAAVTVTDTGRGIASEDHARVFDKFERLDPDEPGGTGLGLYIARRLARAMGGDVVVESAVGEGARFTLTLPAG